MPFMVRNTGDDFQTLLAINAMEQAGAKVVAITTVGLGQARFQVWARIEDDEHIDRVDEAIEASR